jgi:hypothetical protein
MQIRFGLGVDTHDIVRAVPFQRHRILTPHGKLHLCSFCPPDTPIFVVIPA